MARHALISVNRLDGVERFARVLTARGYRIIATDRPLELLREAGLDVSSVAEFVGVSEPYPFPPTLHPRMELSLTTEAAARIDIVYDLPYPIEEGMDVGGHALLALAIKGNRIPICTEQDMLAVTMALELQAELPADLGVALRSKAANHIVRHGCEVARQVIGGACDAILAQSCYELANGENPYQAPATLMACDDADPLALHRFERLTETPPCFTNMADLDCVVETLCRLANAFQRNARSAPYIAIAAKHGNACGIGVDWNKKDACIEAALWGNPLAVWGGEFVANFRIDGPQAVSLVSSQRRAQTQNSDRWMLDVIAAPSFGAIATEVLSKRKLTKVLVNPALEHSALADVRHTYRPIRGGLLRQPPADYVLDYREVEWTSDTPPDDATRETLAVAWAAAYTSNHGGNEVAIAKDRQLLAVGGGPSTVEAAQTAVTRARRFHDLRDAVFVADAFFPFTDAPAVLATAGCRFGLVPDGGRHKDAVQGYFSDEGLNVGFLPEMYRGFCRH